MFSLDDLREFTEHDTVSIPVYTRQADFDYIAKAFPYIVDTSKVVFFVNKYIKTKKISLFLNFLEQQKAVGGIFVPKVEFRVFDPSQTLTVCGMKQTKKPTTFLRFFSFRFVCLLCFLFCFFLYLLGLRFQPLVLDHGAVGSNSTCMGFRFGGKKPQHET